MFCANYSLLLYAGHISGIVQIFLYAFIVGVQGAFLFQEWLYNFSVDPTIRDGKCLKIFPVEYLWEMTYPFGLLCMQLCVAPFIVRSRRNYREGRIHFSATRFSKHHPKT